MKERIQITVDYEIEYENADGRRSAMDAALNGGVNVHGVGFEGRYRATRLGMTIAGGTEMQIPKQESLL